MTLKCLEKLCVLERTKLKLLITKPGGSLMLWEIQERNLERNKTSQNMKKKGHRKKFPRRVYLWIKVKSHIYLNWQDEVQVTVETGNQKIRLTDIVGVT